MSDDSIKTSASPPPLPNADEVFMVSPYEALPGYARRRYDFGGDGSGDVIEPCSPCTWESTWSDPARTLYTITELGEGMTGRTKVDNLDDAILISSAVAADSVFPEGAVHAPALDFDFPCRLVPSSKEGHYHLYLDVRLPWGDYKKLLETLRDVGLLQYGFVQASLERGMTMLAKPGLTKAELDRRGIKRKTDSCGSSLSPDPALDGVTAEPEEAEPTVGDAD